MTRIAAIIPARMASTRFPGKPLLNIAGLPMIEHIRRRALLCCGFSDVVVATCDPEIESVIKNYGGKTIMTAATHRVATERIVEAMQQLDCTHVVNVQGDEILVLPSDLERITKAMEKNMENHIWNAIATLERSEDVSDASVVKCIVSKTDRLLFCSRDFSFLPSSNNCLSDVVCQVVGILGYSRSFLNGFHRLEQTPLELLESIEQSRFLEYDFEIQGVRFEKSYHGINTPQEADAVKKYLETDSRQQEVLRQIL